MSASVESFPQCCQRPQPVGGKKKSALGGRSFDGHSRPKEDCIAAMLRLLAEAISTGLIPKPLVGMNHLRTTTCKSPGFNTTRIPLKVVLINS